jgi:hypothetical protein
MKAISRSSDTEGRPPEASQESPADLVEPADYCWTEAGYEARQAIKKYSEDVHADY